MVGLDKLEVECQMSATQQLEWRSWRERSPATDVATVLTG